ncbi:MAG: cyclic nucleotide-binding domain-containing protein [Deltaproteobacteria bacterium]|nr:cyclic nucleotide-binding domain-containing protein [Deltaproteobacteria bacterium]
MSGGWGVEFEFVEGNEGGGEFISSGGHLPKLQGLINKGDVDQASRLYEETGGTYAQALLEDAKVGSNTTRRNIAEVFRRARDFAAAARVLEQVGDYAGAGVLYEQANDFPAAARCHRSAGDEKKAAPALERSGDYEPALEAYRRAGDLPAAAECLVRLGRLVEAAGVYRELGNVHAEVEVLRQVPLTDAKANVAILRLAGLMETHGHVERAASQIIGLFRANEAARSDTPLQQLLLRLLETMGRTEDAARVRATLGLANAPTAAATPLAMGDEITAPSARIGSEDDYSRLKAIPIFGELSLPDMRDLFRVAQEVSYPPGSAIIDQGAASQGLVVISAGKVDVSVQAGGQTRLLNSLGPGAYVGEIGLVRDAPASARVVAQGPVRALFISKPAFEHYLYEHPAAALAIYRLFTQNLAERVRALSERS